MNKNVHKVMLQLMPDCADVLSKLIYDFMLEASQFNEAFLSADEMAENLAKQRIHNSYASERYVEFPLFPSPRRRLSNKSRKILLQTLSDLAKAYRLDGNVYMYTLRLNLPCGLVSLSLSDQYLPILCDRN